MAQTIDVQVWPARVIFTVHRKEWAKHYQEYSGEPLSSAYAGSKGLSWNNGSGVFLVGVFDGSIETLVHEMGHTTMDILNHAHVGDFTHDTAQEQFCYLIGWLVQRVAPTVMKGK